MGDALQVEPQKANRKQSQKYFISDPCYLLCNEFNVGILKGKIKSNTRSSNKLKLNMLHLRNLGNLRVI